MGLGLGIGLGVGVGLGLGLGLGLGVGARLGFVSRIVLEQVAVERWEVALGTALARLRW